MLQSNFRGGDRDRGAAADGRFFGAMAGAAKTLLVFALLMSLMWYHGPLHHSSYLVGLVLVGVQNGSRFKFGASSAISLRFPFSCLMLKIPHDLAAAQAAHHLVTSHDLADITDITGPPSLLCRHSDGIQRAHGLRRCSFDFQVWLND